MKSLLKSSVCSALAALLCIAGLSGCGSANKAAVDTLRFDSSETFVGEELSDGVITENERFSLIWESNYKQVIFADKKTGARYSSMPVGSMTPEYDENGDGISVNPLVMSPLVVYYYDAKQITDVSAPAQTEAVYGGGVYTERIEDGIRVTYVFTDLCISVPVEFTISKERFNVSVEPTAIKDDGERIVTGVALAPFMCSAKNDSSDSWLFYPDGSGALINTETIDLTGRQGQMRVYGEDLLLSDKTVKSYTRSISFPVFGAKNGGNAVMGIITSGSQQAYLNWDVGARNVGYSAIYAYFSIRGYKLTDRPARFLTAREAVKVFDKKISEQRLCVSFYTLSGEDASYSGMAKTYRRYLTENGKLKKQDDSPDTSVFLKLLGGITQKKFSFGIPHSVTRPMTSLSDAAQMLEYFTDNINGNVVADFVGFCRGGINSGEFGGGFKLSSALGTEKELKDLCRRFNDKNAKLFWEFDLAAFSKSSGGFSAFRDCARYPNQRNAYISRYDNITRISTGDKYRLLAKKRLTKAAEAALKTADSYYIGGLSLPSLSNVRYSDYSAADTALCGKTEEQTAKLLSTAGKNKDIMLEAPNAYAAVAADIITSVPQTSSGYDWYIKDVPFYDIVFHGYIPLCSEPVNLSSDYEMAWLKCLETAEIPSFILTYRYENGFASSDCGSLYGADYFGFRELTVNLANSYAAVLKRFANKVIDDHRAVGDEVYVTTYDDGSYIAVNYGNEPFDYKGETISPLGYSVREVN